MDNNSEPYILTRSSQVHLYENTNLFYKADNGHFILYKPSGKILSRDRIIEKKFPK